MTKGIKMNLAIEPWIPVLHRNGEHRMLSLYQVFHEGDKYTDFAVRPHERIALMRLLICVAQASLDGPKGPDEWEEAPSYLAVATDRYLEKWRDAFDLFHPARPFLQIPMLQKDGDPTPVTKLDFALATGNASTLFDHDANKSGFRSFSPVHLALLLLTYLNFSPGGLIAQVKWNGQQTSKSSGDAPCISSSMYHSFVRGNNLFSTIQSNLLSKTTVHDFFGADKWGRPIWEKMPSSFSDHDAVVNATETYLGRLVPLPRLVLLNAGGETMLLGDGLRYPVFPLVPREPSATVVVSQDKRMLLSGGRRDIWRELPALIVKRHADGLGGALTITNVPDSESFDLCVGALLRKSGQAEVLDTMESVLHVPAGMQTDAGMGAYEAEVLLAENIARRLGWAVETYREHVDGGWQGQLKAAGPKKRDLQNKLHAKAKNHYWTSVEKLRPLLAEHVGAVGGDQVEESRSAWRKAVHGAARKCYWLTCGRETSRQMRAFALGWDRLFAPVSSEKAEPALEDQTIEA